MPADKRAFYEFHSSLMEPWDGPASVAFTDGTVIGAVLDRNGLRPSPLLGDRRRPRRDGVGGRRARHARREGRAEGPPPARAHVPRRHRRRAASSATTRSRPPSPPSTPTTSGCTPASSTSTTCPPGTSSRRSTARSSPSSGRSATRSRSRRSSSRRWPGPAYEPIGSMGTDTPIAVLSEKPRLLFDYFQQLFAQVTNPPLDAIREELVTSLSATLGPEGNLLDPTPASCRQVVLPTPILTQRRAGQAPLHQRRRRVPRAQAVRRRRALPRRRGRRRPPPRPRRHPDEGVGRHRGRRQAHHPLRPPLERRAGADPVAAAHLGGAPPPHPREDPHAGRAHRRDRRGPRGAPHGAAPRLRRGGHQPVPRLRHDRRHDQERAAARASPSARPSATTSRRAARACSRSCRRWASRRSPRTPAPRSSRPSASAQDLVDEYFTGTTSKLGGIGLDVLAEEAAQRHRFAHLDRPEEAAHRDLWRAASTSGGARASSTSSTPRPSSSSSTPRARSATTSSRSTRRSSTTRRGACPRCAGCSSSREASAHAGADRRGRAGQRRSSSGSRPAP